MTKPRTTVIIPVYNGEAYIREAIESVLAQTVPCRLIVVDDGSTDATSDIMRHYWACSKRCSIFFFSHNFGAAIALDHGICAAETEFVCWLSHDDVFYPEKIALQEAFMDLDPEASACYTDFDIIAADGTWESTVQVKPPIDDSMFWQVCIRNIINGSSIMIRRKVFDEVGLFREDLPVDVDGEMWLRMLASGHRFVHLPEVLLKYRCHAGQLSANKALMLSTKDDVRAEWIEEASGDVVFPLADGYWANAYQRLARTMQRQGLTQAAEAARRKAKEVV